MNYATFLTQMYLMNFATFSRVDVKLVITKLWPYFNGSEAQEVETLPT